MFMIKYGMHVLFSEHNKRRPVQMLLAHLLIVHIEEISWYYVIYVCAAVQYLINLLPGISKCHVVLG